MIRPSRGREYKPNMLEVIGDSVVKLLRFCWSVTYYSSPVLLIVLYRRGMFMKQNFPYYMTRALAINAVVIIAIFIRTVGRYTNKEYVKFLKTLSTSKCSASTSNMVGSS
ncbi:hypothetical protein NP493_131g03037 [Ridgeia piscesae]|uniref:Phosphatidylserine Lipase ABHD16 N-terminal domain-containing protein n=1 Tax=Ridgeia piscesae TaxID=27915 RepID=A0AAD9UGN3_RIDPI|nr:hypothetical protein NP493_131g03037 [Ridgeia piscesae]